MYNRCYFTCSKNNHFICIVEENNMKKINGLIMRKRFVLFVLLFLTTFLMNLFLWNETTQMIRQIPLLISLKENSTDDVYELNYQPSADENNVIQPYSQSEQARILQFLENSFFDSDGKSNLYSGKQSYLSDSTAKMDKENLTPVTKEMLNSEKQKESYKKAQAQLQKAQKDEKTAQ